MEITEFKRIGKTNRYKIFVDNNYYATVMDETIVKYGLKLGEVEEEPFKELIFEAQKGVALDMALKLLENYSKTEKELRKYLYDKGYVKPVVDYGVEKLRSYGYVDDRAYASMYLKSNVGKKGKRAIGYELKLKGVKSEIIDELLEEVGEQGEAIVTLGKKFVKNKPHDQKLREKLYRHLLSKGFDYSEVSEAIKKVLGGEDESWD